MKMGVPVRKAHCNLAFCNLALCSLAHCNLARSSALTINVVYLINYAMCKKPEKKLVLSLKVIVGFPFIKPDIFGPVFRSIDSLNQNHKNY